LFHRPCKNVQYTVGSSGHWRTGGHGVTRLDHAKCLSHYMSLLTCVDVKCHVTWRQACDCFTQCINYTCMSRSFIFNFCLYFIISSCMFVVPFVLGAFCHLFNKRILDWICTCVSCLSICLSDSVCLSVCVRPTRQPHRASDRVGPIATADTRCVRRSAVPAAVADVRLVARGGAYLRRDDVPRLRSHLCFHLRRHVCQVFSSSLVVLFGLRVSMGFYQLN